MTVSGFQLTMPGLPAVLPARIAVIGRHTRKWYFASYKPMVASAKARSRFANTVTVCSRLACRVTASLCAISFHTFQIGAAPQNLASVVSSVVRVVLESRPRLLTWLSARA